MPKHATSQILEAQQQDKIIGFHFTGDAHVDPIDKTFGNMSLHIERVRCWGVPQPGFGLILQASEDTFLGIGFGFQVSFSSTTTRMVEIVAIDEGEYREDGKFHQTRRLNGDESMSGTHWVFPDQNPNLGDLHVPIMTPANTGLSTCTVFVHTV